MQPQAPAEETLTYDSGLKATVKNYLSTKSSGQRLNFDEQASLLLVTNIGAGEFYKDIKVSKPLASGEVIASPGICFRTLGAGQILEVITPCCWVTLDRTLVSRKRMPYVACKKCRQPLVRAPMVTTASSVSDQRAKRLSYSDFATLSDSWGTVFTDAMEGILWSADLLRALEHLAKVSKAYRNELELEDKVKRKQERVKEKARFEEKIITKYLDRIEQELVAKGQLPEKYLKLLRASTQPK